MQKVGIRFCGGCSPCIERMDVYRGVQALANGISFVGVKPDDEKDLDAYLFICGCPDGCPVDEVGLRGDARSIVVAGDLVDDVPVRERDIPEAVMKRLWELIPTRA